MWILYLIGLAMMVKSYYAQDGLTFVLGLVVLLIFSQGIIVLGDEE